MPVSANAFKTGAAVVNREDLSNILDLTQRSDTPIYSMISNGSAKSVFPEWPVDAFDAPGENIQSEGRDYTFATADAAKRPGNHMQILEKTGKFTASQEASDNAGRAESMDRDRVTKGMALKTDVEYSLADNKPSLGGDDRQSGSLETWAETNVDRGAGGANGGFNTGTKVTAASTPGAQRAFTKALLDNLLLASYSSGAKLKHMFLSPYNKGVFASFMSNANVAQFRYAAKNGKNTIVADAEVYQGPLGTVFAHPNFVMGGSATLARNIFVLDTSKVSWLWFRKIAEDKGLAKTGDFKNFVLQGEGGVKVANEKAVGVIADVFGLTATT